MSLANLWNQVDSLALADIKRAGYQIEIEAAAAGTRARFVVRGMLRKPWGTSEVRFADETVRGLVRQLDMYAQEEGSDFGPPPQPRPDQPTQRQPGGRQ